MTHRVEARAPMKVKVRQTFVLAFVSVCLSCGQHVYALGIGDIPHYNRDNTNVWWFLHASDTHIMKPSTDFLNAQIFKQFLESNANLIHPDFVVISGDLVQAGKTPGLFTQDREEWQTYFDIVNSKGWNNEDKLFDIPGNHDRYKNPDWLYYKVPNPNIYSVQGANPYAPGQFYKNIHSAGADAPANRWRLVDRHENGSLSVFTPTPSTLYPAGNCSGPS